PARASPATVRSSTRARSRRRARPPHSPSEEPLGGPMDIMTDIAILVLAAFVGFEVISKVPNTLHTPLMSGTNAIHGIVLLGGLLVLSSAPGALNNVLLVIAITFGTINIVGGFLVTDRMLEMFKGRRGPKRSEEERAE